MANKQAWRLGLETGFAFGFAIATFLAGLLWLAHHG